jgi:hypothetical protein
LFRELDPEATCDHLLYKEVTFRNSYGIDQSGSAEGFLRNYPINQTFNGLYNRNDFTDIDLDGNLTDFEMSGSLIAGFVLGSFWILLTLIGCCYAFSIEDDPNDITCERICVNCCTNSTTDEATNNEEPPKNEELPNDNTPKKKVFKW